MGGYKWFADALDACELFTALLWDAREGADKAQILRERVWQGDPAIAAGEWRHKSRDEIASSGNVVNTLEAAIWCVAQASSFEEALILAVNLADDADTVGAVTGQLAGAIWGFSAIPERWLTPLAWREEIIELADRLTG